MLLFSALPLNTMKEKPGLRRGVQVPKKIESILDDAKSAEEFSKGAQKILQT